MQGGSNKKAIRLQESVGSRVLEDCNSVGTSICICTSIGFFQIVIHVLKKYFQFINGENQVIQSI